MAAQELEAASTKAHRKLLKKATTPAAIAVDETVILLHPPLPLVGASIVMERQCQQYDRSLVDGQAAKAAVPTVGRLRTPQVG